MALPLTPFRTSCARILDGVYVIVVAGELDLHTVPQLEELLDTTLDATPTAVVVDLLELTFLDSTALALLVASARRLRTRGGRLILATDSIATRRIFEITGLGRELELTTSLKAAVEKVAA